MKFFLVLVVLVASSSATSPNEKTEDKKPKRSIGHITGYDFGSYGTTGGVLLANSGHDGYYTLGSNYGYENEGTIANLRTHEIRTVTKLVPQPYPVHVTKTVPVPQPYPVHVPVRVPVEVPKPYAVKVPYKVEVPKPYPVHITKTVKVPVEKPVYVKVPHPVTVTVKQPYPVPVNVPTPVIVKVPQVIDGYYTNSDSNVNLGSSLGFGSSSGFDVSSGFETSSGTTFGINSGSSFDSSGLGAIISDSQLSSEPEVISTSSGTGNELLGSYIPSIKGGISGHSDHTSKWKHL